MLYYRWKKSRGYIDAGKLLDVVENTRLEKLNAKINHVRIRQYMTYVLTVYDSYLGSI